MPSQQQLKWSQLRVGLTVIFASIVLVVLIFLMTGSTGLFTKKITLYAYFDNAGGLRVGAPVRLEGVDIGNVKRVRVVASHALTPVQVTMQVTSKYVDAIHKDSRATLSTAGVLGEVFVDISSREAKGPPVQNGDVLAIEQHPELMDVVRASQSTLQNVQALVNRADHIMAQIESGEGSVGKLIYDPTLFNRLNSTLAEFQKVANALSQGKGSLGKLIVDDELYRKANGTLDKVSSMIDQINEGQGTVGKLIKDPSLYNNANQTISEAKQLMAEVNAGKGTLGLIARDQAFAQKVNDTVSKLSDLATKLNSGQGTVGKLLHDTSVHDNTNKLLVETRDLVAAVRKDPKKYLTIHLKVF